MQHPPIHSFIPAFFFLSCLTLGILQIIKARNIIVLEKNDGRPNGMMKPLELTNSTSNTKKPDNHPTLRP